MIFYYVKLYMNDQYNTNFNPTIDFTENIYPLKRY